MHWIYSDLILKLTLRGLILIRLIYLSIFTLWLELFFAWCFRLNIENSKKRSWAGSVWPQCSWDRFESISFRLVSFLSCFCVLPSVLYTLLAHIKRRWNARHRPPRWIFASTLDRIVIGLKITLCCSGEKSDIPSVISKND